MPSSVIRSFAYNPAQRQLEILFQSGRRYVYEHVPPEVYEAMKAVGALGTVDSGHHTF